MSELQPITDQGRFAELVAELAAESAIALDTEFHRERTYYPKVAMLQLGWRDRVALVDPLEVEIEPLSQVLESSTVVVIHAASQDLEVLLRCCGTVPRRLFDTQLAAGFLGMSTPSLGALAERELGINLPKGDRLSDWLARPLTDDQLRYAASDVEHLLELSQRQVTELQGRGRLSWAEAEFEELRDRAQVSRSPEQAWLRIKEARQLKGRARGIARSVAAWREERAMELDQPPRFVLGDLAVVAIAQRAPATREELSSIRGVEERQARGELGRALIEAVRRGIAQPVEETVASGNGELARELRPAVALISSWVSHLAREVSLDTTLLATRADLEALVRGDPDARLLEGWRSELVGEPIRRLLGGSASLAFDQQAGLVLEDRSRRRLELGGG